MDTAGNFVFRVLSPLVDNLVYDEFTIESASAGAGGSTGMPDKCLVTGSLSNLMGQSPQRLKVTFIPIDVPARYGQRILAADAVWTYPDHLGNFGVELVRGATMIVEIERTALRHQIVVPDQASVNLISLLPSFTNDYSL
jgi:hypothetical protein